MQTIFDNLNSRRERDRRPARTILCGMCCAALGIAIGAMGAGKFHKPEQKTNLQQHVIAHQTPTDAGIKESCPDNSPQPEMWDEETGSVYSSYSEFYVQVATRKAPPGKRYRFMAVIGDGSDGHFFLHNPGYPEAPQMQLEAIASFEKDNDYETFLASNLHNNIDPVHVVASMETDGLVDIIQVH